MHVQGNAGHGRVFASYIIGFPNLKGRAEHTNALKGRHSGADLDLQVCKGVTESFSSRNDSCLKKMYTDTRILSNHMLEIHALDHAKYIFINMAFTPS